MKIKKKKMSYLNILKNPKKQEKMGGRDKSKIEEYNPKYQKGCKKLF